MNARQTLQSLAEHQSTACFVDSHIRPDNVEERQKEGLGMALAQWADWDGLKILQVCRAALEDANFHEETQTIKRLIETLEGE